jgi:hypothetical protein
MSGTGRLSFRAASERVRSLASIAFEQAHVNPSTAHRLPRSPHQRSAAQSTSRPGRTHPLRHFMLGATAPAARFAARRSFSCRTAAAPMIQATGVGPPVARSVRGDPRSSGRGGGKQKSASRAMTRKALMTLRRPRPNPGPVAAILSAIRREQASAPAEAIPYPPVRAMSRHFWRLLARCQRDGPAGPGALRHARSRVLAIRDCQTPPGQEPRALNPKADSLITAERRPAWPIA